MQLTFVISIVLTVFVKPVLRSLVNTASVVCINQVVVATFVLLLNELIGHRKIPLGESNVMPIGVPTISKQLNDNVIFVETERFGWMDTKLISRAWTVETFIHLA